MAVVSAEVWACMPLKARVCTTASAGKNECLIRIRKVIGEDPHGRRSHLYGMECLTVSAGPSSEHCHILYPAELFIIELVSSQAGESSSEGANRGNEEESRQVVRRQTVG